MGALEKKEKLTHSSTLLSPSHMKRQLFRQDPPRLHQRFDRCIRWACRMMRGEVIVRLPWNYCVRWIPPTLATRQCHHPTATRIAWIHRLTLVADLPLGTRRLPFESNPVKMVSYTA
jgi:hypothetical protein